MTDDYSDYDPTAEKEWYTSVLENVIGSSICAIVLTIFISFDVHKAFKRKAHWIPAEALVLTALVILLLTFGDNLNLNVDSHDTDLKDEQIYLLVGSAIFYSRRVMICLFISYFLPRVVRSGLITVWGDIGALALPVMWHMGNEVYFLLKVLEEEKSRIQSPSPSPSLENNAEDSTYKHLQEHPSYRVMFTVSYITLFTALILLIVLLTCALIAGKSIRKIMSQKIPLALSCCCNCPEKHQCNDIEIHLLKCFIVTRASQADYIIARSVFSAFAGLVNTFCFVLLVVEWIPHLPKTWFGYVYCIIHFAFILIAWIVVLFRWFRAVMYFPKDVRCLFYLEDFWTRSIVDMKNDLDAHLTARLFRQKRIRERTAIERIVVNLMTAFRLHSLLLNMGLWVQKLMVSVCKACWYLSDLPFRMIRRFTMSPESALEITDPFYQYREALEIIRMPGELAYSLWIANLSAFKMAENNINQGFEKSKATCTELITLMGYKTGTVEDEAPTSLEDEKHFKDVGQKSWKMRAVSLLHFMIYLYDGTDSNVVNDSIQAFSQAWCFMDFVDSLDTEGQLVSLAADKQFDTIETIWKNHLKTLQSSAHNTSNQKVSNELLEEKIKRPLKQHMERLCREELAPAIEGQMRGCVDNLHDSKDWMAIAANISLYKRWKVMDLKSNSDNVIHDLRCLLANLIAHCMGQELDKALIENCGRWAKDGNEKDILNAAFVAGKARAVRDQIMEGNHQELDQIGVVAGEGDDLSRGCRRRRHPNDVSEVEDVEAAMQ